MTKTEILSPGPRVGEEELALAREGGAPEKAALARRLGATLGDDGSADNQAGREQARKILDAAATSTPKKIARADLKRAVALYAGPRATDKEKAAVSGKVLEFLNKRQIAITT